VETIIKNYLQALRNGNYAEVMALFAANATVVSPLYGVQAAALFYKKLLADTNSSQIELLDVFTNVEKRTAAVNFIYHWTLANDTATSFDCVDVFDFDEAYQIKQLKIIYDTVQTRSAFEQQKRS
jgi:hypothetical protein